MSVTGYEKVMGEPKIELNKPGVDNTSALMKWFTGAEPLTVEQLAVGQDAKVEDWREETSATVRTFWPVWAFGWVAGLFAAFAKAGWSNLRRGYLRHNSSWYDDEEADGA